MKRTNVFKLIYIKRELRKQGYSQDEIDHLFKGSFFQEECMLFFYLWHMPSGFKYSTMLPEKMFQEALLLKNLYYPRALSQLLDKCDRKLFKKIRSDSSHPLYPMLPQAKGSSLRLKQRSSQLPRINTERFKSSFLNRLSFKYN